MTDKLKLRKLGIENHPTVTPIPIAYTPYDDDGRYFDDSVLLVKDSSQWDKVKALADEHNALVDRVKELEARLEAIESNRDDE